MEKYKNIAEYVLNLAKSRGADKAQCTVSEGEMREFNVEGNEFSLFRTHYSRSVGLTLFKDDKKGSISINSFDEAALNEAVDNCITAAESASPDKDWEIASGIGERERYVEVINNYDFDFWFIDELGEDWASDGRIYRLDGYLFPDTYQFYNASSEETVIKKLLSRFNQVFVKSYKERAAELGYTVDEILTLASIIEKEAANQSEFGDVSSVFHNRLNDPANYPRLESDATVVYSITGLVPGPIANPSNSAILAALNPKNTNYYYFVSNGKMTYFAKTLQEHNANKAKYLKGVSDANS